MASFQQPLTMEDVLPSSACGMAVTITFYIHFMVCYMGLAALILILGLSSNERPNYFWRVIICSTIMFLTHTVLDLIMGHTPDLCNEGFKVYYKYYMRFLQSAAVTLFFKVGWVLTVKGWSAFGPLKDLFMKKSDRIIDVEEGAIDETGGYYDEPFRHPDYTRFVIRKVGGQYGTFVEVTRD
ncbi:hypothetical protein EG329_010288 [Mollisiaceae sp. DMI_Dod_QoI]|nr:hypothetical protein EG329_010288 [Helotiales sp. DMI_Dod_QoI]